MDTIRTIPLTKEQALQTNYGSLNYDITKCAWICLGYRAGSVYQCTLKPGHGPNGLFCHLHGSKAEQEQRVR